MSEADLIDLLTATLAKRVGRTRPHWRRVLGPVKVYSTATHPSCNWSIEPSGSASDVEAAQVMLDHIRAEHPFVASARG